MFLLLKQAENKLRLKLNFAFSVAKRSHRFRLIQHFLILTFILGMELLILFTISLDILCVGMHIKAFHIAVALDYVESYVGTVCGYSFKTGKTLYKGYTALYGTLAALQAVYMSFPYLFAHGLDHITERLYFLGHIRQVHCKRSNCGLYDFADCFAKQVKLLFGYWRKLYLCISVILSYIIQLDTVVAHSFEIHDGVEYLSRELLLVGTELAGIYLYHVIVQHGLGLIEEPLVFIQQLYFLLVELLMHIHRYAVILDDCGTHTVYNFTALLECYGRSL